MSWKEEFPQEKRYFETENGILYHGDCVEILQRFPSNTIDLIVTSPPYDDLRTYGGATWNFSVFQAISNNIPGVMIEGGRMVWIVSDATNEYDETGTSFRQALYFKDNCGLKLNDIVLDMFFGSGTTGIACEKLNRRWIGIEISEKYCEIAKKRILENIGMF